MSALEQPRVTPVPGRVRWAAVLLGALIVLVTVSALTPLARVCGGPGDAAACRPLSYGDPVVLLTVGLVVLIAFPDLRRVKVSTEGVEAERDPELLSDNADLLNRITALEEGKVQEWSVGVQMDRSRRAGGGDDDGDTA